MAVNYFAGKTQAWLEAELAKVQADLAGGSATLSAGSGEVNRAVSIQADAQVRYQRLYYALYILDPDTYPATGFRTTRTKLIAYQGS